MMESVEYQPATTAYPEVTKYQCKCGATGEIQKSYVLVEGNTGRSITLAATPPWYNTIQ
jgi:hypothetical protein